MMWSNYLSLPGVLLCFYIVQGVWGSSMRSDYKSRSQRECKGLTEECRGYPTCCGDTQCYFKDGYGPRNLVGICVPCIDRTLACQRDEQCCHSLICHKDKATDLNGVCDILREKDGDCHEDKQCKSGDCDLKWHHLWGVCT